MNMQDLPGHRKLFNPMVNYFLIGCVHEVEAQALYQTALVQSVLSQSRYQQTQQGIHLERLQISKPYFEKRGKEKEHWFLLTQSAQALQFWHSFCRLRETEPNVFYEIENHPMFGQNYGFVLLEHNTLNNTISTEHEGTIPVFSLINPELRVHYCEETCPVTNGQVLVLSQEALFITKTLTQILPKNLAKHFRPFGKHGDAYMVSLAGFYPQRPLFGKRSGNEVHGFLEKLTTDPQLNIHYYLLGASHLWEITKRHDPSNLVNDDQSPLPGIHHSWLIRNKVTNFVLR